MLRRVLLALCLAAAVGSAHGACVPTFGARSTVVHVAKGGAASPSDLGTPRDLQFHPLRDNELWVASASNDGRLHGNFIIRDPGTPKQTTRLLRDRVAFHYMDNVAAFEFSKDGRALFTCQESLNTYMDLAPPNFFQGPTAFEVYPCKGGYGRAPKSYCTGAQNAPNCANTEECQIFTVAGDGKTDCTGDECFLIHSDMLHEAPYCMGIAVDAEAKTEASKLRQPNGKPISTWNRTRTEGNVVWMMDGLRGRLMRFDMDELHGTQVIDHRKANIRRYVDVHLTRREGVPGHMQVDSANKHLYISDTGAGRILRVKTDSGSFHRGAMCNNHQCYRHENHFWTCGKKTDPQRVRFVNESMCQTSDLCRSTPSSCFRDIDNLCKPEDGGWCAHGECAGDDGLGCYTTFTEMGHLFEYELWGGTEYEVFSTELSAPAGIALTPDGRVLVADHDTGHIVAFDKAGKVLDRLATGNRGLTALELKCEAGAASDAGCKLWFTNTVENTVSYVSVEAECSGSGQALPASVPALVQACTQSSEPCTVDRAKTTSPATNFMRPDFEGHNGPTWQERMVVWHSYGKDCSKLGGGVPTMVRGDNYRVGNNPDGWTDEDAVQCEDRLDCKDMNLDLLVMAGYFCHPCLPNPCMNNAPCTQGKPRIGFTCTCPEGFSGKNCEVDESVAACCALATSGGSYTPAATCATAGAAKLGVACTLQCANENMVRVAVPTSEAAGSGALVASLPAQTDLMQRVCRRDDTTGKGAWSGLAAACACRSRYFGSDCSTLVEPSARVEARIGAKGGKVLDSGTHGAIVPEGALAADVTISVHVYGEKALDKNFPPVSDGFVAMSDVVELLPEGLTFAQKVTVSVGLSKAVPEDTDRLALFYWDALSGGWTELKGSALVKEGDLKDRAVQGLSSHFSRWVVLQKPAKAADGLHWGVWVGIIVGVVVFIAGGVAVYCYSARKLLPSEAGAGDALNASKAGMSEVVVPTDLVGPPGASHIEQQAPVQAWDPAVKA